MTSDRTSFDDLLSLRHPPKGMYEAHLWPLYPAILNCSSGEVVLLVESIADNGDQSRTYLSQEKC